MQKFIFERALSYLLISYPVLYSSNEVFLYTFNTTGPSWISLVKYFYSFSLNNEILYLPLSCFVHIKQTHTCAVPVMVVTSEASVLGLYLEL